MIVLSALTVGIVSSQDPERVDERLMATYQRLDPAGWSVQIPGRPVDIALSDDRSHVWVKDNTGLRLIQVDGWKEVASIASEGGASLTGLAAVGDQVFFSNAQDQVHVFERSASGLRLGKSIKLAGPGGVGASFPCGISVVYPGALVAVCLSRNNSLAIVDVRKGTVLREIPVGVAPYDVLLFGRSAVVSNQGGRRPATGARTSPSAGTETEVDERGVAKTGTLSVVDVRSGRLIKEVEVGLQPSGLISGGQWVAVANANSDSVTVVSTHDWRVLSTIVLKPDNRLPFGSMPNALAVSGDGRTMFVALAGNNAVAIVDMANPRKPVVRGFVPTGWYPGALAVSNGAVYVANVKGVGSRSVRREPAKGWNSHDHSGTVQKFLFPTPAELSAQTAKVGRLERVPQTLAMLERLGSSSAAPVPLPARLGDPSVIEHVVYIIKENRTYDQVFGDIEKGSGMASLCVFPRKVTPNHHALAEEYVLLDNYYCEGVLSADGHSWATEGNVTPYLEKAFGGFSRSYTFGDDPITYSSTGFIWDHVLAGGLSFRNFGEMDNAETVNAWSATSIWRSYDRARDVVFKQSIGIERLRRYTSPDYPGWHMGIPDVLRADRFLAEFREMERSGTMPNLTLIYLPQDHTAGTTPGYPTVASYVADNDLALGRIVEALSKSKFWPHMAVFVNEDDPQAGFDHVDGHRSLCLVVSPWTKRGAVVSKFYNQNSVLHTVLRMFGLPPMNKQNASAPLMGECFSAVPDFTAYSARDPEVDMGEVNPPISSLTGEARKWAEVSKGIPMWRPGLKSAKDDDDLNRIVWHAMKGYATPYPSEWAGFHGRGLRERGLALGKGER
jgi:DNA-binding beta-propeller fold protein YncE/phospholipase C